MNILLTNDDGIGADGFRALIDALKDDHRLFIVAPENQQSAKSHSITMNQPIYAHTVNHFKHENVITQVAISGTPVDCVKMGVEVLIDEKIDLIMSGINHGPNIAEDVIYSGTVGAAYEGCFYNIPAIALSVNAYGDFNFSLASDYVKNHIDKIFSIFGKNSDFILNINFPNEEYKGTKLTKLGKLKYVDIFSKRQTPHGKDYYWLAGEKHFPLENNDEGCDTMAVTEGYVSISPVKISLVHEIENNKDLARELESYK
jgi:5'-nucleotidase